VPSSGQGVVWNGGEEREGLATADSGKPKIRKICQQHFTIFHAQVLQRISTPLFPTHNIAMFCLDGTTKYAKARVN